MTYEGEHLGYVCNHSSLNCVSLVHVIKTKRFLSPWNLSEIVCGTQVYYAYACVRRFPIQGTVVTYVTEMFPPSSVARLGGLHPNDLSVNPSPRAQGSQWQSIISCTGSGTRTSLGFSAMEKHGKIWGSHRFYGVYDTKMEKLCACCTCNTDFMYPERMRNIICFITFPESKQNRAKCPLAFNLNTNEDKMFIFWLSYTH